MADEKAREKRVGDYILGETLGQGSFGKVKLAINVRTKEKVKKIYHLKREPLPFSMNQINDFQSRSERIC